MRKIIICVIMILAVAFSASAQRRYIHAPAYYYDNVGEVRLHVAGELGIGDLFGVFMHRYPRHYSAGLMAEVQSGRVLSLGLGADYYATRNIAETMDRPYLASLPLYGNIRLTTRGHRTRFFVEARAGYAFPLNYANVYGSYSNIETRGFFTGGGIGFTGYRNSISFGINAIDVRNYNGIAPAGTISGRPRVITDFYLRYSYAFPLLY